MVFPFRSEYTLEMIHFEPRVMEVHGSDDLPFNQVIFRFHINFPIGVCIDISFQIRLEWVDQNEHMSLYMIHIQG